MRCCTRPRTGRQDRSLDSEDRSHLLHLHKLQQQGPKGGRDQSETFDEETDLHEADDGKAGFLGHTDASMRNLLVESQAEAGAGRGQLGAAWPKAAQMANVTWSSAAEMLTSHALCAMRPSFGGSATMIASLGVFLYEGISYNVVFLGRVLPAVEKDIWVPLFAILFNCAWCMALWSYYQAHIVDPGVVPKEWHNFVTMAGNGLTVVPARLEWQPGRATLCRKCGTPRPERAHHCHMCGVCVLRMDHHCPWIKNCVGFKNHKFFLLLVIYSMLTAIVGLATTFPELIFCAKTLVLELGAGEHRKVLQTSDLLTFLVFGLLALLFLALLTPMLVTHLPLAMANITSIESHYDNVAEYNPFDQGSSAGNLEQIFGERGLDWLLPVAPSRPLSDGVTFGRRGEEIATLLPELQAADGSEALEAEALWRLRYGVKPPGAERSRQDSLDSDFAPLTNLARWFQGGDSREEDDASPASEVMANFRCTQPAANVARPPLAR